MWRSDAWRGNRYSEEPREIAFVMRGLSDYFGSALDDRSYAVTFEPLADTLGATDVIGHRVILNPAILNGKRAPFDGRDVDEMMSVAAHEAGHALMAAPGDQVYDPWNARVTAKAGALAALAVNLIEDMMIDGKPYAHHNRGLAELTAALRVEQASEQTAIGLAIWKATDRVLSPEDLLKLWGVMRLHGAKLPAIGGRAEAIRIVNRLDPIADRVERFPGFNDQTGISARSKAVDDVLEILTQYTPDKPTPKPQGEQGEPGDEEEEGEQGEPGEGEGGKPGKGSGKGEQGEGKAEGGSGSGKPGEGEPDNGGADGQGEGSGEQGEPGKGDAQGEQGEGGKASGTPGQGVGSGAGDAKAKAKPINGSTADIPDACPNHGAVDAAHDAKSKAGRALWREVKREAEAIEATRPVQGKSVMAPYVDKRMTKAIAASFDRLASEPDRGRRVDRGKIDKRRLPYAGHRDDVFTALNSVTISGQVVMLIDLSGSMNGYDRLVKSIAASVYVALQRTEVKVSIYSYGQGGVPGQAAKLADARKVYGAFDMAVASGGTPTAHGFRAVLKSEKPGRGENMIIHVTDGGAEGGPSVAGAAMDQAIDAGWHVVNVFVGFDQRASYRNMTRAIGTHITKFDELPGVIEEAIEGIVKSAKSKAQRNR